MSSWPTYPSKPSTDVPLVSEGGLPYKSTVSNDPIQDWIDLMELVEALCPKWPERTLQVFENYRL